MNDPEPSAHGGPASPAAREFAHSRRVLLLVIAVAACLTGWQARSVLELSAGALAPWMRDDGDVHLIIGGLEKAPRLMDTLRWWTGTWAGQVPFYRPLTSYVFWLEWNAFGGQGRLYNLAAFGAHLLASLAFTAFVYRLAETHRVRYPTVAALGAVFLWVGFLSGHRSDVVHRILMWKNQPDSLAAACCFFSLLSCLSTPPRGGGGDRAGVLWYLAACGFKEVAVPLPLVLLALPGGALRKSEGRRRAAVFFGAAALFLVVRWLALRQVGYQYGSNTAWGERTLAHLAGPFGEAVTTGQWLGAAVGVWAFLVAAILRAQTKGPSTPGRPLRIGGLSLCLLLSGWSVLGWLFQMWAERLAWADALNPGAVLTGLLLCLQVPVMNTAFGVLLLLLALLWRENLPLVSLALVWTAAFLAPIAFSPGPVHRYYLSGGGYVLLGAFAVASLVGMLAPHLGRKPLPRRELQTH